MIPNETRRIAQTFSRTTPESTEAGDFSDSGWIDEDGREFTLEDLRCEQECHEGVTFADLAVEYLLDEGVTHASATRFGKHVWYETEWYTVDYRTGEDEKRSFHLRGFTYYEQRRIHWLLEQAV